MPNNMLNTMEKFELGNGKNNSIMFKSNEAINSKYNNITQRSYAKGPALQP